MGFSELRKILICVLILTLPACAPPPAPELKPFADNQAWVLTADLDYSIGNTGTVITVPRGFVTDFASVPRALWWWSSPHDDYSRAAVVHDYLYWVQNCTRLQADNLMLIAMKESEVTKTKQVVIYRGVRLGGNGPWKENRSDRDSGDLRILPDEHMAAPPNDDWPQYHQRLRNAGVTEKPVNDNGADYCALGDSVDVPDINAVDGYN